MSQNKQSLSERMREYEEPTNIRITKRIPLVIQVDGNRFSKFTKRIKLEKPFDSEFSSVMVEAAKKVAAKIQGCVLAYTQSDEISFVIRTDQSDEAVPWFGNRLQKMCSLAASFTTGYFNQYITLPDNVDPAAFDGKVIPLPNIIEVYNRLLFRQRDCTRNSIGNAVEYELGRAVGRGTARKMAHKLNQKQRQELLFLKAGVNWNDYPEEFKRGTVIFRDYVKIVTENGEATRRPWVNRAAPIFSSEEGRAWLFNVLDPTEELDAAQEEEVR